MSRNWATSADCKRKDASFLADLKGTCCHFAKQRHTIMLPRYCEARPCATYGYRNYRWHIHRLSSYSVRVCKPPYSQNAGVDSSYIIFGDCLHAILVNCYILTINSAPVRNGCPSSGCATYIRAAAGGVRGSNIRLGNLTFSRCSRQLLL